jgi:hypothetical protein
MALFRRLAPWRRAKASPVPIVAACLCQIIDAGNVRPIAR